MTTDERRALGDLVRTGRLRLGLTQAEFGRKIGLAQRSVSKIEQGETEQPRLAVLMQLARVLEIPLSEVTRAAGQSAGNVNVEDFFGEEDIPPELQASFLSLRKLSPDRMRQAQEMLEVLVAMDDDEFQRRRT